VKQEPAGFAGMALQTLTRREFATLPIALKSGTVINRSEEPVISFKPASLMFFPIPKANTVTPNFSQAFKAAGTWAASVALPSVKTMHALAVSFPLRIFAE